MASLHYVSPKMPLWTTHYYTLMMTVRKNTTVTQRRFTVIGQVAQQTVPEIGISLQEVY